LLQAIEAYLKENPARFHMPGHKGKVRAGSPLHRLLGELPFRADLTEVPGLDDLHDPKEAIRESEKLAAEVYGARETFFLVNGATAGIVASFLALLKPGDKVILPRHVHKSVFNALVLSDAVPVYVAPTYHPVLGIPLGVPVDRWEEAWDKHPEAKMVFFVHPTYEGIVSVDQGLVARAKARGFRVVVDEAHGGHFPFHSKLPQSTLAWGADVVIQGSHKTMGSFTQSGMLHLGSDLPREPFQEALRLIQSTSPSYLLLASLEGALYEMACRGQQDWEEAIEAAGRAHQEINAVKGFRSWQEELFSYNEVIGLDPTKIIIDGLKLGLTGYALAKLLRKEYTIQVEMAGQSHILVLFGFRDSWDEGKRLVDALKQISHSGHGQGEASFLPGFAEEILIPEMVVTPRDSWFAAKKQVRLEEAENAVCGELVVPYPPGIPLLCPGELITAPMIRLLLRLREQGIYWQGLADPALSTIRVLA